MKYLIPIIFLAVGVSIGYYFGSNTSGQTEFEIPLNTKVTNSIVVHDTVIKNTVIEVPVIKEVQLFDTVSNLDSSAVVLSDSLLIDSLSILKVFIDTIDIVNINRDRKVSSKIIEIVYLVNSNDKDSLIKDALDINDVKPQNILIEFWESPVNFRGYKMSKSKLIVYGLSAQFDYAIYINDTGKYLNFMNINYTLIETDSFLPLSESTNTVNK